jgi:hypothetical protein
MECRSGCELDELKSPLSPKGELRLLLYFKNRKSLEVVESPKGCDYYREIKNTSM